jgi:hypothetical protein
MITLEWNKSELLLSFGMGSEEIVHVPTDKPGMMNGKIGRGKWSEGEATFRRSSRFEERTLAAAKRSSLSNP